MRRNKKGPSPRGAKKSRGGWGDRGGRSSPATSRPAFVPFIGSHGDFTLADEARQTSQHDHLYQNLNLRQRPVAFVSAGPSEPLKLLDELLETDEHALEEENNDVLPNDHNLVMASPSPGKPGHPEVKDQGNDEKEDEEEDDGEDEEDEELIGPEELEKTLQSFEADDEQDAVQEQPMFFFDLNGDPSQAKQTEAPVNISDRPSSQSSDSSEEVILFKGRDAHRKAQTTTELNMTQMSTEIQVVEEQIVEELVVAGPRKMFKQFRKQTRKNGKRAKNVRAQSDDEATLADYIANMRENGDADDLLAGLAGNHRDLGGTDYYIPDDLTSDDGQEGTGEQEDGDVLESASEVDDATLAKLIAGLDPDANENGDVGDDPISSSSSDDEKITPKKVAADDEFDFMDWERPSLRRKRKGKGTQAQINFNVSDSELEQKLQVAWKNDRLKKSERKKQREELRALGMLGKKTDPDDLRIKYPDGMNIDQIADEFRSFLMGTDDTIALPPMDNHARKMIHELATKFKIKSKSIGKAEERRPTLIRTLRTLPYVEATFDQAMTRMSRRYFPRLDLKGKKPKRAPQPSRSSNRAAMYQDGEIIGAAAPELGTENRGRAMLEKMGWSSGTALGASNNKGILQPVTQTMKRSKTGLG